MAKKSKNQGPNHSEAAKSSMDCQENSVPQPTPEVLEFCRILAGVLRRTPQGSLVDVEGTDHKSEEQFDIS